ncbi:MAG: type VI secretion system contractile sheath large subunit [Ignavibacteriota bacterium]
MRRALPLFLSEVHATRPLSFTDPEVFLKARTATVDRELSTQVNAILHSAPFQQLEATWRGLYYLVSRTESGSNLKIRVLNISKKEFYRDLIRASSFDTSIFFKKVHDDIYGSRDSHPFAAFILDFVFGPQPQDIQTLSLLSNIAARINAPCIAAASPEMINRDTFADPTPPGHLGRLFESVLYAPWRNLRASEDSRYLALTLPRALLRLPYGCTGQSVEAFDYQEDIFPNKRHHYLWGNAAYVFGARLTDAFAKYGWCAAISGTAGGVVDGLAAHFLDPFGRRCKRSR